MHESAKKNYLIEVLDLAEKVENAIREVISAGVWKHYRITYEREFDDYYVTIRVRIPLDPQGDC